MNNIKCMLKKRLYSDLKVDTMKQTITCVTIRNETCIVLLCDMKVGVSFIKTWFPILNKFNHFILIGPSFSFQSIQFLDQHLSKIYYEILHPNDISFDKTSHYYVPQYRLLNQKEQYNICKKYGDQSKFPCMISKKDAIAKYMGFRSGDMVEIKCNSLISGYSIYYRQIIDASNSV
jgi:DNA-directed RNA polymerase subunit H (RpoH/RPB5)